MGACEAVFATVELLDMILIHTLPPNDSEVYRYRQLSWTIQPYETLSLQRVNKTFYNHINGDTEIARALHLVPGGKATMRVHVVERYIQLRNVLAPNEGSDRILNGDINLHYGYNEFNRQVTSEPWGNLQLFQPPITKLGMVITDGTGATYRDCRFPPYEQGLVVQETVLTVKDMMQAGKDYLNNAPKCSYYRALVFFARTDENGKELVDLDPRADCEAVPVPRMKLTWYNYGIAS